MCLNLLTNVDKIIHMLIKFVDNFIIHMRPKKINNIVQAFIKLVNKPNSKNLTKVMQR